MFLPSTRARKLTLDILHVMTSQTALPAIVL